MENLDFIIMGNYCLPLIDEISIDSEIFSELIIGIKLIKESQQQTRVKFSILIISIKRIPDNGEHES